MLTALVVASIVLAALVAVLKVVAPKTKTALDDEALAVAEKLEAGVVVLKDLGTPGKK